MNKHWWWLPGAAGGVLSWRWVLILLILPFSGMLGMLLCSPELKIFKNHAGRTEAFSCVASGASTVVKLHKVEVWLTPACLWCLFTQWKNDLRAWLWPVMDMFREWITLTKCSPFHWLKLIYGNCSGISCCWSYSITTVNLSTEGWLHKAVSQPHAGAPSTLKMQNLSSSITCNPLWWQEETLRGLD